MFQHWHFDRHFIRAGSDVKALVDLDEEQLVELCLVAKGYKEGTLPRKLVKEMTVIEMMQMMMEREEKMRRE